MDTTSTSEEDQIRTIENARIVLSDGTALSALIWLPTNATTTPVPAILEYLPYRKRDFTAPQDALIHPYFAAQGYACVRVDMRGTGDSEGLLRGEYLKLEQDDALEILKWIASQDWCTGSIGMIGISWGGFNGLQVAALRPPELKAVISVCSTDDRYDNDIHYMGGCLLLENFAWGAYMFALNGTPPDPALVGDSWRDIWLRRLESGGHYIQEWHENQRRNQFWKHASVCEDYSAIECPVYLVGGWLDPYRNSIFRMLQNLQCPKKGLVGPWGHQYPNIAKPGPQIGFLQESLRWWDHYLKGIDTGIMEEPMLRCYIQDSMPPQTQYHHRPGRWVAESSWPSATTLWRTFGLAPGQLTSSDLSSSAQLTIRSPSTTGFAAGRWISYGDDTNAPDDQCLEAGGSLIFDSPIFEHSQDILGSPVLNLRIASSRKTAFVAAVFSELLPSGGATKLSYGLCNLSHRNSHEHPDPPVPDKFIEVQIVLNHCGQRISKGNRIRLAISSSYFPITWPSPESAVITVDCSMSSLALPYRSHGPLDSTLADFKPAVTSEPLEVKVLREGEPTHTITRCLQSGMVTKVEHYDSGLQEKMADGWRFGEQETITYSILPNDPLSACAEHRFSKDFGRGDLELVVRGHEKARPSKTDLHFTTYIEALENGQQIFARTYEFAVARDLV
jgi:uncharacterized protein